MSTVHPWATNCSRSNTSTVLQWNRLGNLGIGQGVCSKWNRRVLGCIHVENYKFCMPFSSFFACASGDFAMVVSCLHCECKCRSTCHVPIVCDVHFKKGIIVWMCLCLGFGANDILWGLLQSWDVCLWVGGFLDNWYGLQLWMYLFIHVAFIYLFACVKVMCMHESVDMKCTAHADM